MKGIIKSIVDECADSVLRAVMAERKIGRDDFHNSRLPRHVLARVIAIKRLSAMGFSTYAIAKIMKRTQAAVRYSLNPELRDKVNATRTRGYAARVQAQREARA